MVEVIQGLRIEFQVGLALAEKSTGRHSAFGTAVHPDCGAPAGGGGAAAIMTPVVIRTANPPKPY